MANSIPDNFRDLFPKKAFGQFATLMKDGTPQVTPVSTDIGLVDIVPAVTLGSRAGYVPYEQDPDTDGLCRRDGGDQSGNRGTSTVFLLSVNYDRPHRQTCHH